MLGTVILTAANTYTGGTTIGGGTLQIGNGGTTGSVVGAIVNNSALVLDRSDDLPFANAISGTGSFEKMGTNQVTITGTNTYTGGTIIDAGTLVIGDGTTNGSITGAVANSGALSFNRSDSITFGGVISGSGSLTQAGSGTLRLSAINTYTGITNISAGTLQLGNNDTTGGIAPASNISIGTGGTLTFDWSNNQTVANLISGTGNLTQSGASVLTLTGANTFSGTTTILAGGTIQLGNGGTTGTLTGPITDNGSLILNRSDSGLILSAVISGAGTLVQQGTGTSTLTAADTYSGGTTVNAGILQIGNGGTTGMIATGATVASGATLAFDRTDSIVFANVVSGAGGLTQLGTGTLRLSAINTYTGTTTIGAGTLQLGNNDTTGGIAAASNISIGTNGTFNFDWSNNQTVANLISGTGNLKQSGASVLTLTGANTFSGTTTIIAGGTIQLGNGGTTGTLAGPIIDNGELMLNRSDAGQVLAGVISGSGTLVQSGTGTSILTAANAYSGGTTISAGTLQLGNAGISGSIVGNITDNGILQFNRTDAGLNVVGNISGIGSVVQNGTGTVTLSGTNIYSGVTTVSAGTLQAGSTTALSVLSAFTVNATLNLNGFSAAIGSLAGSGIVTNNGASAATLTVGGENTSTIFSGVLQNGTGALVLAKSGTGTFTLTGTNIYAGGTTIGGGTLQLGNATASGSIVGNITDNGVLQFNRTDAGLTVSGNIIGIGSVVQVGSGSSSVSGTNTYSGVTTVTAGTLQAGSTTAFSAGSNFTVNSTLDLNGFSNTVGSLAGGGIVTNTGAAAATLTAGSDNAPTTTFSGTLIDGAGTMGLTKGGTGILILTGTSTYTGGTTISGGTLQLGNATATGSIVGNITDNAVLELDRSDSGLNLAGNIAGTGSVIDTGLGTSTLSGTNTYSGVTTVSAGTLQAGSTTALSAASGFTVNSTLNLNGFSNSIGSLAGTGTVTNSGAAATLSVEGDNLSTTFSGTLQNGPGAFALTKTGTGTLTLSGVNTYSGATTASAGTLQAGSTTGLSPNSDFIVNSILDLNGYSNAIGSLAGIGTITNNRALAATLTAGSDNNPSTTFSGVLQNGLSTLGLSKSGTGTLILTGTSTYSGLTDVQAGLLSVRGALSNSAVHVETGATLGGTGTIDGTVTVLSGGILSPGNSPGTLTVGSLVLNAGSFSNFDLGPARVVGGTANDLVIVTNNLTLAGSLNIADAGGFGAGVYRLFNYGGILTNNVMTIGRVPNGVSPGGLSIQTSVANQINLVVNGTSLLEFWDGNDAPNNGVVGGGNGTWNTTNTNWTVADGSTNSAWKQGLAVFESTPGTVTLAREPDDGRAGFCHQWLPDHDCQWFGADGRDRHDFGGRQRSNRNRWGRYCRGWRRDQNRCRHGDLDGYQYLHGRNDD